MPLDVAAFIAAHGLASAPEPAVVDHDLWAAVRHWVERDRLTGLACAALTAGQLVLEPEDEADLAALDRVVQQRTVRAERLTLLVADRLARLDVPFRVLKGPAVAHRAYADPAHRPFRDVDVLVPSASIDQVVQALMGDGATRPVPELRRGFDRRFAKSVTLRHPDGIEIDVHRTLCLGPLTHLVREEDLWTAARAISPVPGHDLPALDDDLVFLHACLHAGAGGDTSPLAHRDIVELAPAADLDRCTNLARRWRATGVVADALTSVRARFPVLDALEQWASTLESIAEERRIAEAYRPGRRSSRSLLVDGFRHLPDLRAKLAYARALALPSAAHRRARHLSAASLLHRAVGSGR